MKIISFNVNGLRSVARKGFENWLLKEDADIVCLQETKIDASKLSFDLQYIGDYQSYFNFASKPGYSGVCVYTKIKPHSMSQKLGFKRFDKEGRLLKLDFKDFTLLNLYVPHGARNKKNLNYKLQVYKSLFSYIKNIKRKLVLVGDFNVAHREIDLANPQKNQNNIMFTSEERSMIDQILSLGLIDSFRYLHKTKESYSWWPYRLDLYERNIGWRIDYCFISNLLEKNLKESVIQRDLRISDHSPIAIDIEI